MSDYLSCILHINMKMLQILCFLLSRENIIVCKQNVVPDRAIYIIDMYSAFYSLSFNIRMRPLSWIIKKLWDVKVMMLLFIQHENSRNSYDWTTYKTYFRNRNLQYIWLYFSSLNWCLSFKKSLVTQAISCCKRSKISV